MRKSLVSSLIILVFLLGTLVFLLIIKLDNKNIGGERDSYGCLISAGYSWNSTEQQCVREWEKKDCLQEQRNADACIEIYAPVCGFNKDYNKETFSNSCFACSNENILYYLEGECK